jgi:hypothetical protein
MSTPITLPEGASEAKNAGISGSIFRPRCVKGASKLNTPCFSGQNRRLDVVMGEIDR